LVGHETARSVTVLDVTNELPEPWASALSPKGIHSYRDMGMAAGVAHETARRLVTGGATSAATVNKVADKLFGGDRTRVWVLYGAPLDDFGPWELPPEASLLNEEQREAVLGVIRAMLPKTATAKKGGDGDADATGGSAPTIDVGHAPEDAGVFVELDAVRPVEKVRTVRVPKLSDRPDKVEEHVEELPRVAFPDKDDLECEQEEQSGDV
jgi:hypothetical protein